MYWHTKPSYPIHYRITVEYIVNTYFPFYLVLLALDKIFNSLEESNRRMRGYALAEGFDIVRHGGGTKALPNYRFKCIFYGSKIQNYYKLENHIKKNSKEKVISKC